MVEGRFPLAVWFERSVDSEVYYDEEVNKAVWMAVQEVGTLHLNIISNRLAQPGESRNPYLDFLKLQFENRTKIHLASIGGPLISLCNHNQSKESSVLSQYL